MRIHHHIYISLIVMALTSPGLFTAEVRVVCAQESPPITFGLTKLEASLEVAGHRLSRSSQQGDVFISVDESLPREAYRIAKKSGAIHVTAGDATGAMYGVLDLSEQIAMRGLTDVQAKKVHPHLEFRAIKFNLPWMSYRKDKSLQLHMETCRDLTFWAGFLDMMAENRFNALTLWNLHPFHYMVRLEKYPEACGLTDQELREWQHFWRELFQMAKDRGIETYIVNWNIFVSPEFAKAHGVAKYSIDWNYIGRNADTSELVKDYTRECVTQVINEYPNLTGLGITLGEQMGGMTPQEREDWLVDTFGAGMKAANRPVKFIHRGPLSAGKGSGGSTDRSTAVITREGIDRMELAHPPWVELKFNWSHGHSSPRLCIIHGGKASEAYWDPAPTNYKLCWTIRNEDFYILRWGEPGFIREHIATNSQDYVGGYFIGSECYIPAVNYIDHPQLPDRSNFAYQRQWLFYQLWGRLLYEPGTPDAVFEHAFDQRFGMGTGESLLSAFTKVSRMPLHLASFHRSTWDFTLYSEGFLGDSKGDQFISLSDLINTKTLDPQYISITEYVDAVIRKRALDDQRLTPVELANALEADASSALSLIQSHEGRSAALDNELVDVQAWAYLGLYFAEKIRGGIAYRMFEKKKGADYQQQSVQHLEQALAHWDSVIAVTSEAYPPVPTGQFRKIMFSWAALRDLVQADIDAARAAD